MNTVLIDVCPVALSMADMLQTVRSGKPEREARIRFASFELLWKTLTPNRMQLIQALTGAGPTGVRELARRVGRDVRAVHADCVRLAKTGVIDKLEDGKLLFPYDGVRVNFEVPKAA